MVIMMNKKYKIKAGAGLFRTDLRDTNMFPITLFYFNLWGIGLGNTNLINTNLEGADLRDANRQKIQHTLWSKIKGKLK